MTRCNKVMQSRLTGNDIVEESFEESLQNFTYDRVAECGKLSAYKNEFKKLDELLDFSKNDEAVHAFYGIQSAVAHSNYIKGFAEGIKFALMAEKL